MILLSYGAPGRPLERVANRCAEAIRGTGHRVSVVSEEGLPGIVSRPGEAPPSVIVGQDAGNYTLREDIRAETYGRRTPWLLWRPDA